MLLKKTLVTSLIAIPTILGLFSLYQTQADADVTCYTMQKGHLTASLDWRTGTSTITNHSSTCTYKVGVASYKAYDKYPVPYPSCEFTTCPEKHAWVWTQTFLDGETAVLAPGKSVTLDVDVASCAYQVDVFQGDILYSFTPGVTYTEQNRFIAGWYNTQLPVCTYPTPTPTRVPTATPTPTRIPTPTPTRIPTPTPTRVVTPTPTKVITPTPTRTPSPTPTKVVTPTPTRKPSPTPTKVVTPTPTKVVTPTKTPTPTTKPSVTPTPTKKPSPTPTKAITPTPTKVVTPTPTKVVTPTPTKTPTPTVTITVTPTTTPSVTPTATPTTQPSVTPTVTPTTTPQPTVTPKQEVLEDHTVYTTPTIDETPKTGAGALSLLFVPSALAGILLRRKKI